jgi:glucose/arabinose dehydrogenase
MNCFYSSLCRQARLSLMVTLTCLFCGQLYAQPNLELQSVISGNITAPIHISHANDGTERIFVAERSGVIKVFAKDFTFIGTYLDASSRVATLGDRGLLSVAFHPDFKTNGCVFVHYVQTIKEGGVDNDYVVIDRYKTTDYTLNTMDNTTRVEVIKINIPSNNHFGGEMHFGTDGNLYFALGDGGYSNDVFLRAQDLTKFWGKMLRITVATTGLGTYTIPSDNPFASHATNKKEIYSWGLRNPFRWSFDRLNGDIWIGDVGQDTKEEIDNCTAAQLKGANFAWRCYEGDIRTPYTTENDMGDCGGYANFGVKYSYGGKNRSSISVTGGVVYRGTKYPAMAGYYIGSDYINGTFHIIAPSSGNGRLAAVTITPKTGIVDFGESEKGDIFAVAMNENKIYKIVDANALPVKLVTFSGNREAQSVTLNWRTSEEENFNRFEMEYSSNASQFSKVGTIQSQSSEKGSAYTFSHAPALQGTAYYRLKMIDNDGSFAYSRIVTVKGSDDAASALVRPSLITNGSLNVYLEETYHTMELVSLGGKVFLKKDLTGQKGSINVAVNSLASGLYIVRLTGNEVNAQQRVMIIQ